MKKKTLFCLHTLAPLVLGLELVYRDSFFLSILGTVIIFAFIPLMREQTTGFSIHAKLTRYLAIIAAIQWIALLFIHEDYLLLTSLIFSVVFFFEWKFSVASSHWE